VILLGLILIVVAAGVGLVLVLATESLTEPVSLAAAGFEVSMTPLALLIAGAVVLLLFWFGLELVRASVRRRSRRRRDAKESERQSQLDAETRQAEDERRADEARRIEEAREQGREEGREEARQAEARRSAEQQARERVETEETRRAADERWETAPAVAGGAAAGVAGAEATDRGTTPGAHGGSDATPDGERTAVLPTHEGEAAGGPKAAGTTAPESQSPTVADRLMGRDTAEDRRS
jgi:membrane protein implicated in regulation of membrane protease activity